MTAAGARKQARSEGLDALDELRAASLADEGGTSAAALEGQGRPAARPSRPGPLAVFCAAAAGAVLLALACRQRS